MAEFEYTWETLSDFSRAYSKQAGHLSVPLPADRLKLFVVDAFPAEFFPDDIVKHIVASNGGVVPVDFLSVLRGVASSKKVAPRPTTGSRKLTLHQALTVAKLFIDLDQDKDGLVPSTQFTTSSLDTSSLPPLTGFPDLVKCVASYHGAADSHGAQQGGLRRSGAGQGNVPSYPSQPHLPQQQPQPQQQYAYSAAQIPQQQYAPYAAGQQSPSPYSPQVPQQYYQQPPLQPQQQQQPYYSPQYPQPNYGQYPPQQAYAPPAQQPIQSPLVHSPPTVVPSPSQPQPLSASAHASQQQQQPQKPLDTTTLLKLFNLADKDGSGALTADELLPIVRGVVRPGIPVSTQHSQMLMQLLDKDGSGTITIDEFLEGAKKFNWNADVLSDIISTSNPLGKPAASGGSGGSSSSAISSDIEIPFNEVVFGERIGEGTFGLVYKAAWRGSPVAVKMLKMQNITESALDEFRKELQILARLRHPNIVLLMGASTVPPNLTFVTEFLDHGSLYDALQKKKLIADPPTLKRLVREIALGMNYLHLSNIIHRDLKSLNILLDHNNTVKICDFGLSTVKKGNDVMTKKIGSPIWMSPELLRGEDYNEKVDVYAFGIILWEIATGELPYPNMDTIQIAVAVSSKGLRPPLPPAWPNYRKELASQCWQDNAAARPSFQQILDILNHWP